MNENGYLSDEDYFLFEGDQYCTAKRFYDHLPKITGIPVIKKEKERSFLKEKQNIHWYEETTAEERKFPSLKKKKSKGKSRRKSLRIPITSVVRAPKICSLNKLINWPFRKWGAYQAAIVGTYGSGKSNLLNLITAFHAAQQGVRILTFNDRRFEVRHLADKGFYDSKKRFHPFQIDVLVPEGYDFKKGNPLYEQRNNVHLVNWKTADDIIENLKANHITTVYTECFTREGSISLWMETMRILAEEINPNKNHIFVHHEFSSLIPETPTKEVAKLVREASDVALNLRKDRIGLITTFHMLAEVFYRFSQKYTYVLQKKPVMRRSMGKAEYDARNFKKSQFNIIFGGRWMKHDIGLFPEVEDMYRLIPQRIPITFPALTATTDENNGDIVDIMLRDPINREIYKHRGKGMVYAKISELVGMPMATVRDRAVKMGY